MNKFGISIFLLILLLVFVLLIRKENFAVSCEPHSIVNTNDYILPSETSKMNNLLERGPPCLTQCLVENVPNVNWSISPSERAQLAHGFESDILQYNRENPANRQDYCYKHNSNNGTNSDLINPCNDTCRTSCDSDRRCTTHNLNNGNSLCAEDNLNMMSSGSNLRLSNCKNCIDKYWNNISNLWNSYQSYIIPSANCNT